MQTYEIIFNFMTAGNSEALGHFNEYLSQNTFHTRGSKNEKDNSKSRKYILKWKS